MYLSGDTDYIGGRYVGSSSGGTIGGGIGGAAGGSGDIDGGTVPGVGLIMAKYTSEPFGVKTKADLARPEKDQFATTYDILSEGLLKV